jgi:hypothetical protein
MIIIQKCISKPWKAFFPGLFILFLSIWEPGYSQAVLGISGGLGVGSLKQKFTQHNQPANLIFTAPGANISAELLYGQVYMEMSFSLLFAPFKETLGKSDVDRTDLAINLGLDFTAIGFGYLHPVNEQLSVGGALGFHVAGLTLKPKDENDVEKLRLGGNYGLIGLGITPRVRYSLNERVKLTVSIPLGFDFGPMSDDVNVGPARTGKSPAIVQPASMIPEFKGFTCGVYFTIGYFMNLSR